MSDLATIITATTPVILAGGGGITWLWRAVSKRFSAIEEQLAQCRKAEQLTERKFRVITMGFIIFAEEMHAQNPDNPALLRVGAMIRTAFPIDPHVPNDWASLLAALDRITVGSDV